MGKRTFPWQKKSKSKLLALEPRMLFDGAAAATAVPDLLPVPEPAAQAPKPSAAPADEAPTQNPTDNTTRSQSDSASDPVSNEMPGLEAPATTGELANKTGANAPSQIEQSEQVQVVETLATLRQASGNSDDQVVFIDDAINEYEALATAAKDKGYTVVVVDATQDGIDQMAQYLQSRSGVEAVHILGHGGAGEQRIGTTTLNAQTLAAHEAALAQIGGALSASGDILLYGCYVAADDGTLFVDSLARMTGADVAASEDPTGNREQAGNWVLEYDSGVIETKSLFEGETVAGFTEVLAAPTFDSAEVSSLSTNEDVALSLAGKISVADNGDASNTMEAVITVTQGNGKLTSGSGADLVSATSLAAQGALVDINTFLDGLGFMPDANWSGTASIKLTVESDYIGADNSDVTELTFDIEVAPVSDAPVGTNKTLTVTEDGSVTLTVADFGFSDPNDDPADAFVDVEITALPSAGSLTLAGSAVTTGQLVSATDIASGKLKYAPATDDTAEQSFAFKVVDDGDAGSNTAISANTLSFEVTKVNDAPVTTSPAVFETPKNTTLSGIDLTESASDPDGGSGNDDAAIVQYILGSVPMLPRAAVCGGFAGGVRGRRIAYAG